MATTTYTATIGLFNEVELSIDYSVFGEHRPATWFDPPEEPELEVERVTAHGEPIPDWMNSLLEEEIQEACWTHANGIEADFEEERWAA